VMQAIDRIAPGVATEQVEVSQDAIGQLAGEGYITGGYDVPVLFGAFSHRLERRALLLQCVSHGTSGLGQIAPIRGASIASARVCRPAASGVRASEGRKWRPGVGARSR